MPRDTAMPTRTVVGISRVAKGGTTSSHAAERTVASRNAVSQ